MMNTFGMGWRLEIIILGWDDGGVPVPARCIMADGEVRLSRVVNLSSSGGFSRFRWVRIPSACSPRLSLLEGELAVCCWLPAPSTPSRIPVPVVCV